jgi:undecaprenyl-diphosphatase
VGDWVVVDVWYSVLKGALQGLTEFLPISSSAHLVLFDVLTQTFGVMQRPSLFLEEFFDILLHIGTLLAVLWYFRAEVMGLVGALPSLWASSAEGARNDKLHGVITTSDGTLWEAKALLKGLALSFLVTALLSLGVVKASGVLMAQWGVANTHGADITQFYMTHPLLVAGHLVVTGFVLWLAERLSQQSTIAPNATPVVVRPLQAAFIGLFQAGAAIFRGISRSGSTMSAGLLSGLTRQQAARYSFLLSIPVFVGATVYEGFKLVTQGGLHLAGLPWGVMLLGVIASAVVGYLCIAGFMRFIGTMSLTVFSWYCWVVGGGLFYFFWQQGG